MRALELHAHAKQVQRSAGHSAVAAAAYRSGEKLFEERTGLSHDYTKKQGVELSRIYLPENAPNALRNREALWNAAEKKENRSNSCTAHELEIGFPYEFNAMQRREAGDKVARELMKRYGCAVDICYHAPNANNDERNYHAHILFTTRGFDESTKDGWAKTKFRNLSNDKSVINGETSTKGKQEVLSLRQFAAGTMNTIAGRDDLKVKIEHLSFKERGIDKEPQIHLGSRANDMKKKGSKSERDTQNNNIIYLNNAVEDRRKQVQGVQYDEFDEFAGAKRSELQQWKWDMAVSESRRCDRENRQLERKLLDAYGESESLLKAQIANLEDSLSIRGASGVYRKITGRQEDDSLELRNAKKSLKSIEVRRQEEKNALLSKQKQRRKEYEKTYIEAKQKVEIEINKARTLFATDNSEGRGDSGDSRGVTPNRPSTYERAKARLLEREKASQSESRTRSDRKPSYSGSDIKYNQRQRLKSKHTDAVKSDAKSVKKRRSENPEFNHIPPQGPTRGR